MFVSTDYLYSDWFDTSERFKDLTSPTYRSMPSKVSSEVINIKMNGTTSVCMEQIALLCLLYLYVDIQIQISWVGRSTSLYAHLLMRLDIDDGHFFITMGWKCFFSKAPLQSMVFQCFYHPWTITIEYFFADQPLKSMGFRLFSQIQVRWSVMVLTLKKT